MRPFLLVQTTGHLSRVGYKRRLMQAKFIIKFIIALIFEFLRWQHSRLIKMAHDRILVLSVSLLVLLLGSDLLSHAEGVDTAKTTLPPRLPIAVEGIIYCRSCKLPGYDKSIDASPIPGAVAKLQCDGSAPGVTVKGTTDKNGYFFIQTNKVTNYGAHKCLVFLESSPLSYCNVPVYPTAKGSGVPLKFERNIKVGSGQQALYTAGAFAFAPAKGSSCPRNP